MRKRVVSLLLAVVMIATLFAGVTAQEVTKVYVDTSDISMKAGEVSTLPVVIENNPGFDSADILIQFDTKAIELVAVLDSYGGQDGLMEAGTILGNIDNRTVNFMSIEVIEGDGILFWIQCRPKAPIINTDTPILILPTEDVDSPFTNTTLPGTGVVECVSDSKNVAITGGLDASKVTPVVTVSGKTDYGYGETATALTANASVANNDYGSTVTYQWYRMDGEEGTEISDATASTYTPALAAFGSEQYYCVATNTLENGRAFSAASDVVTVTYSKKSLDGMTLTLNPSSTAYTGQAQTVAATVDGVSSEEYTVSGNTTGTNVGSYTVTATAVVDGNYTGFTSATWEITPATLNGNGSTAMTVYTNGETYKVPFAATSVDHAAVTYSYEVTNGSNLIEVDDNGYVTAKGTDTGSAAIEVTANCPNHNELKQTISVTVANKQDVSSNITFTAKNVPQVYTGSDIAASTLLNNATVVGEGLDGTNLYYTYNGQKADSLDEIKFQNAGDYTVTAVYEDDTHYGAVPVTVTIGKATIDVSGYRWDYTAAYTYDGTEKTVALTGVEAGKVLVTYGGTTTAKNAGSYSATASLAPVDSTNYQLTGGTTKSLDWAISPKSVELSITGGETVSYGTTYSHAASYDVVAGDKVDATITYLDASDNPIAKPTNAGSYQVMATINDANYSADPVTQDFTIKKAVYEGTAAKTVSIVKNRTEAQTGTLTASDFLTETLDGATITEISTGTTNVLSKVPTVEDGVLSYTSRANLTGTISDDVYTVTIETTNYNNITATLTFRATDKTDVSEKITFEDGSAVYNGAVQTYEKATCTLTTGTIRYTYSATEVKNAGEYTVTATYEDDFNMGSKTATFTITQKPVTVSAGNAAVTKTYDGSTTAGTLSGSFAVNGICSQDVTTDGYVTDGTIPDYSNANVHSENISVPVTLKDNFATNYSLSSSSVSVLATITPKAITPTVEDIDAVTYNGKAQTPAVTVKDGETALTAGDYTVKYENNVNAGTAKAIITAKAGGNYTFDQVTKTFTINKANFGTVPSKVVNIVRDRAEAQTGSLSAADLVANAPAGATVKSVSGTGAIMAEVKVENGKVAYTSKTNLDDTAAAASYTVTIESTNYNNFTVTLTFQPVDKEDAKLTLTAPKSKTYGDGAFQLSAAVGNPGANGKYTWSVTNGSVTGNGSKATASIANAGTMMVTVTYESDTTMATATANITIDKATITVRALDRQVRVGMSVPTLGNILGKDYTVEGLGYNDKLGGTVTLSYAKTPNTSSTGRYEIVPAGGTVPNTTNYNAAIVYESGYLTVVSNEKPQVTVTGGTHGFATISNPDAKEGDVVAITVTCDPGYEVDEVTVTTLSGKSVRVVKTGGKYTFVMPAEKVKIQVTYQEIQEVAYSDVVVGSWYEEAVAYVSDNGLMNGVGGGKFAPNRTVTRAMVWTVLARMDGEDTASTGLWYAKAQQWAMETSVSDGTNPESAITREQLATMLYRYYGSPAVTGSLSGYADGASVSDWAKEAVVWAVQEGLIQGTGANKLSPTADTTRAQLAQILMRLDLKF